MNQENENENEEEIVNANEKIIGRGTWLDKVAEDLVEREKKLGRSLSLIRVESGLGASGIPHVGSIGDAVRAYGVRQALKDVGYNSELIAYSDDMDGLRKVPVGLPEWLNDYIAHPVSKIPDPFGCHSSYGAHMSSILTDGLDKLSVEYKFQSGAEAYRKGLLANQVVKILENSRLIGEKISEMLGQTKFEDVLPYYPVCGSCGRIYVAEAYRYEREEKKVLYRCRGAEIAHKKIEGCGHEGEADVTKDQGKLSWKSEFAARWAALDIRFEAYGKDIADSVKVNDWIAEAVLNYPPPFHVKYEMFLDKSGKKISKSLGNVFTPQAWLTYGTPQSLLLLMYKRIAGTRNLSVEDIPTYMDEYDALEDVYFGKVKEENPAKLRKTKGLYEYINHLNPPKAPSIHASYRLIAQIASVAPKEGRTDYVIERLKSYRAIKEADEAFREKVRLAANWADEFSKTTEKTKVELTPVERIAVAQIVDFIRKTPKAEAETIQNVIFEAAKTNSIPPTDLFRAMYRILIGTNRGPRLGTYIVDIGTERAADSLSEQLDQ
ncbi:MAG: lysine--tRNA ligase [Thaumarchaeota archaeon]|nr:lysine--tRNA ligase [Nitrososphaerota archaeon]